MRFGRNSHSICGESMIRETRDPPTPSYHRDLTWTLPDIWALHRARNITSRTDRWTQCLDLLQYSIELGTVHSEEARDAACSPSCIMHD